jgi:aryl-alcohol dehydrogenase-like predicted oxidoreductase
LTVVPGCATPEGTDAFRARFAGRAAPDHFARHQGLWLSSVGVGTYLGEPDDATDAAYAEAVAAAVEGGCNVIDTAVNYRCQRSERSVGRALAALRARGIRREELLVCTKGGYLAYDGAPPENPARWFQETFVRTGVAAFDDIAVNSHCMTPAYLEHQLETSRRNLGVACIDVYYLHNPETELEEVGEREFVGRLREAFRFLEGAAASGRIRWYGAATWDGFRTSPQESEYLPMQAMAEIAKSVGGEGHRFRFLQLPFNLAMGEAFGYANQTVGGAVRNVLDAAAAFGLTVVGSAALQQGRVLERMGPVMEGRIPGFTTPAQRALQFARSAPGLATALVGMRHAGHVEENLAVAAAPRMDRAAFAALFG